MAHYSPFTRNWRCPGAAAPAVVASAAAQHAAVVTPPALQLSPRGLATADIRQPPLLTELGIFMIIWIALSPVAQSVERVAVNH